MTTFTPTVQVVDRDGVAVVTLDDPDQAVNTMNEAYVASMERVVDDLDDRVTQGALRGVVLTSGKPTFFAGGDLGDLVTAGSDDAVQLTAFVARAKAVLRRLELLGVPVVAAINGSALGGGLEIALACHRRILLRAPGVRVGLPEVTLGLLPGGGGVVRTVRLLGLDTALDRVLLDGRTYGVDEALDLGLVDEVVAQPEELVVAALTWIAARPDARQPWDVPGFSIPGGAAGDPQVEAGLPGRAAALRARHRGAPMPAAAAILAAAVESTQVDLEAALEIETRYFVDVATGPVSSNVIRGTFFDLRAVRAGSSRPEGFACSEMAAVAVIGAGLMGSGIALSSALAGLRVVLQDVDEHAALRGRDLAAKALGRRVTKGLLDEAEAAAVLARIHCTADPADLAEVDLVVEAVFEDPALKARILGEVQHAVGPSTLLSTNTSTLPISELARAVERPGDFVGLHFFSPVERMDLVEIVVGTATSEATVARAFDAVRQLGKTPIVVGDGRGFFTSRVILSRLLEASSFLAEGVAPASIEQASLRAGYPTGTLALLDDLTLTLPATIHRQFREAGGDTFVSHPGAAVLEWMIDEANRPSRSAGTGFYDYAEGRRAGLWPGLEARFGPWRTGPEVDLDELSERLLFAEALDTARCLESGLLRSEADANVGSLLGIGYPRWTGGSAQFVRGFDGGVTGFVARADALAAAHGSRFEPTETLRRQAKEERDA